MLSTRLSLMVVCAIAVLLTTALAVMYYFSRQALREEAMLDAAHTLESTALHIDNILLSVEQAAGNTYWDMVRHLDQPDCMETYCRELVAANRYVVGCAVAFKPHFFHGREKFMAYVKRKVNGGQMEEEYYDSLVTSDSYLSQPYTEQAWYTDPMATGAACWIEPTEADMAIVGDDAIISFCLPIYTADVRSEARGGHMQPVGVLGVDVALKKLSDFILAAKPSQRGYSALLGRSGAFIVHPDSGTLFRQSAFLQMEQMSNPSVYQAVKAMMAGESGFVPFYRDGERWHVMFKPFKRSLVPGRVMYNLGWSVGVVYPDSDIFRGYNVLLYYLVVIVVLGLLTVFALCLLFTRRQLFPLVKLTRSAQNIADGNYREIIPDTMREDEVGQLQDHFQKMQRSLAVHMDEQERLKTTLEERGRVLRAAYDKAQEADRMKTAFLHNMTNQLVGPSDTIDTNVTGLCNQYHSLSQEEVGRMVNAIQKESEVIVEVLNNMLHTADSETGKEASYE